METQPARFVRFGRRAFGLAASVLLAMLFGLLRSVVAQEGDNRAGLVVRFRLWGRHGLQDR